MRVFVLGTGRCGTVTFSKACSHITNYTSGHETHAGQIGNLAYPDKHIEVDPHLVWVLPLLMDKYPEAYYVHLTRKEGPCRRSLEKRSSLDHWAKFACMAKPNRKQAAWVHYWGVKRLLDRLLEPFSSIYFPIEKADSLWPVFWDAIGAEGDIDAAAAEFNKRYNRSK